MYMPRSYRPDCVVLVVYAFISAFGCCKILSSRVLDLIWTVFIWLLKFLRKDWPLMLLLPFLATVLEMGSVLSMLT